MRFFLLLFNFIVAIAVGAQGTLHIAKIYSMKDGISSNDVTSIKQDSRGFLWIATREGLNRFDGYQFKKYFFEKNNSSSLTHNNIFNLLEYQYGQLLIATGNGLSVLNTLTGKFENNRVTFSPLKPGLGNTIQSLYKDKQGNIWVNHQGEIDVLDSNLKYQFTATNEAWGNTMKGSLIAFEDWQTDSNNRLWFLSDTSGIHIIDFAKKQVFNTKNNPEKLPYLQYSFVRSFFIDEDNNAIWYAPWGRALVRYDLATKKEQFFNFNKNATGELQTVNSIAKTNDGQLLCGLGLRYFLIDPITYKYTTVLQTPAANELINSTATTILKFSGQYWVGTSQGIILIEDKTLFEEVVFKNNKNIGAGSCSEVCFSASGKIYASYENNIFAVVDTLNHTAETYRVTPQQNNGIFCMAEDGLQQVWIGSATGLYLFNEKNKTFGQPSFLPDALQKHFVNKIFKDTDGSLWISTRFPFSLYHYYPAEKKFEKINNEGVDHFASFGNNSRISNFSPDVQGNLWMSSRLAGGIICYNKQQNKWTSYPPKGKNYEFFQKKGFTCMYADNEGYLWLSNYFRDGLMRYDYKTDSIILFTRNDGLLNDYILSIYGDNAGMLWLTSENGITAFNTKTLRAESSTALQDAGNDVVVSANASVTKMAVGLPDRLMLIKLPAGKNDSELPIPLLDKVTVNNQPLFVKPGEEPSLSSEQKNISIDFTAIDLTGTKTAFAYQLSGVDKNWKFTETNRNAQYSILAPGHYSLLVKTGANNGRWSQPYSLFSFTINPPWWRTWWFLTICIIAAGLLIFLWVKNREHTIKKQAIEKAKAQALVQEAQMQLAAQQHKMAEAEMLALRAQMNPHFLFNSLNSINNYILKNDAENAAGYLTKFSRLMRIILENSRSNWISLENELKALELYVELEAFRFDNSFTYTINIDSNVNTEWVSIPPMIIQPYAENAIWHGLMHSKKTGSHLQIDIFKEKDMLCIAIKDNGVGRQHANRLKNNSTQAHKSHGMKITAERMEIMNKVYGINAIVEVSDLPDTNETGTRVLIKLKHTFQSQEPIT